jgi:hypothetical protein
LRNAAATVTIAAASVTEEQGLEHPGAQSDDPQPPGLAGFLLATLAKSSSAAEAAIGDMHERYARDCARYGVRYATLYCWGHTLRSLWPLIRRALGRGVKWAAIISAVKRLFVG